MTRRTLNRPPRARSPREVARHARELADAFAQARRTVSATAGSDAGTMERAAEADDRAAATGEQTKAGRSARKRSS